MFDPRIYRAALLPAVAAFVLMMFSLEPIPGPLQAPVSTPEFDTAEATRTARSIVELAPEREPGSAGDTAVGDLVRERFAAIEGGEVAVQDFDSTFDGEDVQLRNVILTLPGASAQTVLVIAHRDSADGPGAATSAAATAQLLSLADALGGARHERTLILASTDGGSDGAAGARELIENLPRPEEIDEALVISQPGVRGGEPPFVITSGVEPDSPSPQLVETARAGTATQFDRRDPSPGPWEGLARLAVPAGLGEQAALQGEGLESIAISGSGERRIPPEEDDVVSSEAMAAAGAAMLDLILTLDEAERAPDEGPDDYIRLGDNLIPGWTLSLLAITLLLPAVLAAADTWLRELRVDWRNRRSAFWALERVLVPLAGLLLAYLLGIVGLVPDPAFPYDPGRYPAGAEAPIAFVVIAAAFALAGLLIRPLRTPLDVEPHTLAAAAGLLTGGAVVRRLAAQPLPRPAAGARGARLAPAGARGRPAPRRRDRDRRGAVAGSGGGRVRDRRGRAGPRPLGALAPAADDRGRPDRLRHVPALVRAARRADRLRLVGRGGTRTAPHRRAERARPGRPRGPRSAGGHPLCPEGALTPGVDGRLKSLKAAAQRSMIVARCPSLPRIPVRSDQTRSAPTASSSSTSSRSSRSASTGWTPKRWRRRCSSGSGPRSTAPRSASAEVIVS